MPSFISDIVVRSGPSLATSCALVHPSQLCVTWSIFKFQHQQRCGPWSSSDRVVSPGPSLASSSDKVVITTGPSVTSSSGETVTLAHRPWCPFLAVADPHCLWSTDPDRNYEHGQWGFLL